MFCENGVPKSFAKSTGKHLRNSFISRSEDGAPNPRK